MPPGETIIISTDRKNIAVLHEAQLQFVHCRIFFPGVVRMLDAAEISP
jgi:hypothetical protein